MSAIDPRTITDAERPFLERLHDLGDLQDLRRRAIEEVKASQSVAAGLCGYMLALQADDADGLPSDTQRWRYRKILHQLLENERPSGRRRRRLTVVKSGTEGGFADVGTMGLVTVLAGLAVALHADAGMLANVLLARLDVTEIMGGVPGGAGRPGGSSPALASPRRGPRRSRPGPGRRPRPPPPARRAHPAARRARTSP